MRIVRWESKTTGKTGYSPACVNEWVAWICEKPRIKCGDCSKRLLILLSDSVIYDHLAGEHTVGVYPLLEDDTCYFLAVDFDGAEWRDDARAFIQSCQELGVPAALEISRSGKGAHAWVFFANKVSARDARRLGTAIISHTCARTRQLKLESYDRLFPNQDSLPKGGFGNLIALPLQKHPRENGFSVFVDADLLPYQDQWGYLSGIELMAVHDIEPTITQATGHSHPLDVTFIDDEDLKEPWKRTALRKLTGTMPKSLTVTLVNLIHPALDTLVLAMPISWKGTLQQYAGRLHREHVTKTDVRIIDFVDTGHPALLRMWDKRQRGYRAMGYRIEEYPQEAAGFLIGSNSS